MAAFLAAPSLPGDVSSDDLLRTLLAISPAGILLLRPRYAAASSEPAPIVDFTWEQLNPAAQRQLHLPERPSESLLTLFPGTQAAGVFTFYCDAFGTGQAQHFGSRYQFDHLDGYYQFVAQRQGPLLLVSFTSTSEQPHPVAEGALRASQAHTPRARTTESTPANEELGSGSADYQRADTEPGETPQVRQPSQEPEASGPAHRKNESLPTEPLTAAQALVQERETFYQVFAQTPAAICVQRGPAHRYEYVNAAYQHFFPGRELLGRPLAAAVPETVDNGLLALLDQVYHTGETYYGYEVPVALNQPDGSTKQEYVNFTYQPYRENGQVVGISTFAYDVAEQVRAHQRVEQLNQELEVRVAERTQQALALQADLLVATQQQAAEREAFYQVFEQTTAVVALLRGPTHQYAFINPAYQALLPGRPLVGLAVADAVPEILAQGFGALLDNVYQTGETFFGAELPFTADPLPGQPSHTVYFNFTYQAYREAGLVVGVTIVAFDVTEQVRARQEREAQQQLIVTVLEQAPVVFFVVRGPAYVMEALNDEGARILGRSRAQLLGRPYFEAMPELVEQGFPALLDQVRRTGQAVSFTEVLIHLPGRPAGQPEYFNFVYQPLLDAQGLVVRVACVATEVTEQVRTRQQLEQLNQDLEVRVAERTQQLAQQQRQLLAMFEQAPVAIFVLRGTEYVFEVVNPGMGHMLAAAPDQLRGRRYFDLLPALEAQGYRQLLDQVWHSGREYVAREQAAKLPHHGEGEIGYYNFTYTPLLEADGRVTGILCVAVDVTSQVLTRQQVQTLNEALTTTNRELHESNQQLTRTNVELDTFIYTASHDLKAPITNIESIALALRSTLPPPSVQQDESVAHLLDLLDQTTARFQVTIGQLTDLSKLQLAHAGPAELVDLAAVIESVRLDLAPFIAAAGAQLAVEVTPGLLVSFSPANLRSALYNLLSNAVKYRAFDRPAQVRLRAFPAGPRVALEVQDNGLGLSAHQQQRLFGLFQRLHTHVEGTGVGLYITKRLVENGGGTIAVASQVDVGTTFTLTFPT